MCVCVCVCECVCVHIYIYICMYVVYIYTQNGQLVSVNNYLNSTTIDTDRYNQKLSAATFKYTGCWTCINITASSRYKKEEKNNNKSLQEELTDKGYGGGNIWSADLSAYATLTSNPVDQLNGYAGSREGIYIRHSFPVITFFPVTNQIMRLISQNILATPSCITSTKVFSHT